MKPDHLQYKLDNLSSDLISDHTPIIFEPLCNFPDLSQPPPPMKLLHIMDWPLFESLMSEINYLSFKYPSRTNVDLAIANSTNILFTNVQKSTHAISSADTNHTLFQNILLETKFKRHFRSL